MTSNIHLGPRYREALTFMCELHGRQVRKGSSVPYISHLMSVSALVLENGADEDVAIAALLHDAAEDQGGRRTLESIRDTFGERVADLVAACSDSLETPKPPWRQRKETYLQHLAVTHPDALLISCADKLHNARCVLYDYRLIGDEVWARFKGGRDGTLWYYRELVRTLEMAADTRCRPLADELSRVVSTLQALTAH